MTEILSKYIPENSVTLVEEILKELNDLVSCDDKNYQLTTKKCENIDNCIAIKETAAFTAPGCSDD